jgi:hypothetical protein
MPLMIMLSSAGAGAGPRRLAFVGARTACPMVLFAPAGVAGALRRVTDEAPHASRRRQMSAPHTSAKYKVSTVGTHLRSINALTLATRDMRKACAFYSKLGLKKTFGGPDSEFTTFSANAPVTPVIYTHLQ